jgi:hypothetical protein
LLFCCSNRKSATERVAFLLDTDRRLTVAGARAARRLRRDIRDYIGPEAGNCLGLDVHARGKGRAGRLRLAPDLLDNRALVHAARGHGPRVASWRAELDDSG